MKVDDVGESPVRSARSSTAIAACRAPVEDALLRANPLTIHGSLSEEIGSVIRGHPAPSDALIEALDAVEFIQVLRVRARTRGRRDWSRARSARGVRKHLVLWQSPAATRASRLHPAVLALCANFGERIELLRLRDRLRHGRRRMRPRRRHHDAAYEKLKSLPEAAVLIHAGGPPSNSSGRRHASSERESMHAARAAEARVARLFRSTLRGCLTCPASSDRLQARFRGCIGLDPEPYLKMRGQARDTGQPGRQLQRDHLQPRA